MSFVAPLLFKLKTGFEESELTKKKNCQDKSMSFRTPKTEFLHVQFSFFD